MGTARANAPVKSRKPNRARSKTRGKLDYTLISIIIILLIFGLVMIYSTSYYTANQMYNSPMYWMKRQGFFACVGLVLMIVLSYTNYHAWRKFIWLFYFIIIGMLGYVLAFGDVINGAKRWISFGFFSVQPSEIAKLVLILVLAHLLDLNAKKIAHFKYLVFACLPALPIVGLIGIENFSTAFILIAISGIMVYVAAPKLKPVLGLAGIGAGLGLILFSMKGYRGERFQIWKDPFSHEKGYQTVQSMYAIGSGGLTGKGLGQSLQKLGFIPEAHNDMIFSIICEELGFIGAIGVIILFVIFLFRLYKIVLNAADLYGALIVVGVMAHVGMQVLVNVAVVTNTIPNTGVPLPFISYGGTSIAFLLAELGFVLSVARTTQRERLHG